MSPARALTIGLLWAVTAAALFLLYDSGRTPVHRYENSAGWGLNEDHYIGEDLAQEIRDGASYHYVGVRHVFEGDAGPRVFAAAVIVPVAALLTARLVRRRPAGNPPGAS